MCEHGEHGHGETCCVGRVYGMRKKKRKDRAEGGWKSLNQSAKRCSEASWVSALGVPFPARARWWEQGCSMSVVLHMEVPI